MDLLVGTEDGLHGIERSGPPALAGHRITAFEPRGRPWWALVDDAVLWWSDGGGVWDRGAEVPVLRPNCVLSSSAGVLVGTSEARLLRLGSGGEVEPVASFDHVEGRDDWYTPWGGPPDVRSMAETVGGRIFANVHVGGIPRSTDGGGEWRPTIDPDSDVHQVVAHPSEPDVVLAATALGLAVSLDGGDRWAFHQGGMHAYYSRAVAVAGDSVIVTASRGPRGEQAAVYRRPLMAGGAPFERCQDGLPEWFHGNIDTHRLAASGSEVAFGTRDGEVFVSDDGGRRWSMAAAGLPPITCVAFT